MKQLSEVGLIEKKKRGQGKPDIIYVMNFTAVHKEGAKEIVPEEQMKQDSRMDIVGCCPKDGRLRHISV